MLKAVTKQFFLIILFFGILQEVNADKLTIDNSQTKEKFTVKVLSVDRASIFPSFSERILNVGEKFVLNMTGLADEPLYNANGYVRLEISRNFDKSFVCSFLMCTINNEIHTDDPLNGNLHFFCISNRIKNGKVDTVTIKKYSH